MASFAGGTDSDSSSLGKMTLQRLKEICKKHDLYRTPSVNDKLYLHYEGFSAIDAAALGEYTGLKCLWLQGNGLSKIEGLDKLTLMRSLCLHENCIEKIEGLGALTELQSLNLGKNFITTLENLGTCKKIETLTVGHNSLGPSAAAVAHILELPALQTLDLQANRLEDGDGVLPILAQVPDLRVVYCQGNPFVKTMRNYRKRMISTLKHLRYLDDRPIFEDERRRADAWGAKMAVTGGDVDAANEAERAEIAKIRQEKKDEEDKRLRDFDNMVLNAKNEATAKREASAATEEGLSFSGEAIVDINGRPSSDEEPVDPSKPTGFVDIDELD